MRARLALPPPMSPWPHFLLSSCWEMCSLSPSSPFGQIPPYGLHLGAAGGTMCLPHCGLFPPLQGISLTHSPGWAPGLLGFPPASWCRAALQASRESLSWFPSSCVGRAFSLGWEVSRIPGGIGVGAPQPRAPQHPDSSLLASDSAWGQHMPCLAGMACSRLQASIFTCGQPRSSLLFSFFSPWYLGVALETPMSVPTHFGEQGISIIEAGALFCLLSSWARMKETSTNFPMPIPSALKRPVSGARPCPLGAHNVVGTDLSEIGKVSL